MRFARFTWPRFLAEVFCAVLATGFLARGSAAECTLPVLFSGRTDYVTGTNPVSIVTGDFNEDGITDLAVSNSFDFSSGVGSSLSILLGQGAAGVGNGTFAAPVYYQAGNKPFYMAAADLNDDGITDLVVSNIGSDNFSVLIGQGSGGVGNGSFSAASHYPAGARPNHLLIEDFNEDGIIDVAVANNGTPSVSVMMGGGSGGTWNGGFAPPRSYPLTQLSTGIAAGDFNEDGNIDLVASENYGGTIGVLLGLGSGSVGDSTFAAAVHYAAGIEPFDITVDDFNDDGISDLAVVVAANGGTAILLGNGSAGVGNGTFGGASFLPSMGTAGSRTADLNQDGITDLVVSSWVDPSAPGEVKVFLGQGSGGVGTGTFGGATSYTVGLVPILPALADFNEDGALDCAIANYYENDITVLFGTCAPAPPDLRRPTLTRVRDVPNDQGGKVFVTWTRSSLDVAGGTVNSYRVWRRVPPEAALAQGALVPGSQPDRLRTSRVTHPDGSTGVDYWEALATLPAQRLEGYGYTAPTVQDSMRHSNPRTAFFVTALTSNIDVFYDSNVDSGYSVDNVPPRRPESFAGVATGAGVALHWDPNLDADMAAYHLYRGPSPDFTPSPENMIAAQQDTGYFDPTGTPAHHYKLSSVDLHDNESGFASLSPGGLVAIGDPAPRFALEGSRPNPATEGDLVVAFSLPNSEPATLRLFDLAGRRLASRSVGNLGGGRHLVRLEAGARIPPGIYVVSLTQRGRRLVTRVVVTR